MTDHLPECGFNDALRPQTALVGVYCICERLRACEQRVLDQARAAILKDHRPVPVIECACGWGKDCPECGSESNRVVGYACDACCNSFGDHAYCDDMHDDQPLHHRDGRWNGPHCPALAAIDALRENKK